MLFSLGTVLRAAIWIFAGSILSSFQRLRHIVSKVSFGRSLSALSRIQEQNPMPLLLFQLQSTKQKSL